MTRCRTALRKARRWLGENLWETWMVVVGLVGWLWFAVFTLTAFVNWLDAAPSGEPPRSVPTAEVKQRAAPVSIIYVPVLDIPVPTVTERPRNEYELQFIQLLNVERSKLGLAALTPHPTLHKGADIRNADMEQRRYYGHYGPKGTELDVTAQVVPLWGSYVAECLYCGYLAPAAAVLGFSRSPGHWRALTGDYKFIGVSWGTAYYGGTKPAPNLVVLVANKKE